jgi:signal peptidase I
VFLFYIKQTFRILGSLVLIILFIRGFVCEPGRINGRSMESTFIDEDLFFINKYVLLLREPNRFDIVQAIDPHSKRLVIKRVIGLPGERLSIHNGKVFLLDDENAETELVENYLDSDTRSHSNDSKPTTYTRVAEHSYFLMGDNRENSTDSRVYGAIHRSLIYGLVMKPPFSSQ